MKKQHIKVHLKNNKECFSKAIIFSYSAAQTASLIESSSLYFLMWSFSFLIVLSVIRSLLWLTQSHATLPQASAVRVFCISAHLLSKSLLSFFFIPLCFLPFALPLCFCNLERCSGLSSFFCSYMYLYLCGIGVMLCLCIGSVAVLSLFICVDWCTLKVKFLFLPAGFNSFWQQTHFKFFYDDGLSKYLKVHLFILPHN